ncbi:hypothetical protein ACFX14_006255 [Malus domestica]
MNNLYSGVKEIEVRELRSDACREMLLLPHNAAESHCKNLVLQTDHNAKPTLNTATRKFFSHYPGITCPVSTNSMRREITFHVDVASAFVTESAKLLTTDDLQLIYPLSESIVSLFTNLGVTMRILPRS